MGDPAGKARDPITGTSIYLEYIEHGIAIVPGVNDVRAGIMRMASAIRGIAVGDDKFIPKFYVTKNCTNFLYEINRYRYSVWAEAKARFEKNKKEEPTKKDDHILDATRYLVMSRPQVDDATHVPVTPRPSIDAAVGVDPHGEMYDIDNSFKPTNVEYSDDIDTYMGAEY